MAGCDCCLLTNAGVYESTLGLIDGVISVSSDVSVEMLFEDPAHNMCEEDKTIRFFGPGKGSFQIQVYPFSSLDDFKYCLACPIELSVQTPWKWIYDCNKTIPCFNNSNKIRKGAYVGIPMRNKTITVTGDLTDSILPFEVGGCGVGVSKFNIQASNMPVVAPQQAKQYEWIKYTGAPIQFDTRTPYVYSLQLRTGSECNDFSFPEVQAFLTGFQWSFTPPKIPTCTFSFEIIASLCPECE
jgi:hypothetical protein